MPLTKLAEFAAGHPGLMAAFYSPVHLRYVIDLDRNGLLRGVLDTANQSRLWRRPAPLVGRTAGIRPLLLSDTVEYTFGLARAGSRPVRARACHEAYLDLLDRCVAATHDPAVTAVSTYLRSLDGHSPLSSDCDRSAVVTFRVNGRLVIDLPCVQDYWAALQSEDEGGKRGVCLVCHEVRNIPLRSAERIRGLAGALTAGTPLVSINFAAAESYGMRHGHGSPICAQCGRLVNWALNHLLYQSGATLGVAGYTAVFWFTDRSNHQLTRVLAGTSYLEARQELERLRRFDPANELHYLGLAANGGRVRVLDFFSVPMRQLLPALEEWIAVQAGEDARSAGRLIGIHQLAAAYVLPLRTPRLRFVNALLRTALLGEPIPGAEANAVLQAALLSAPITRARRALFHLCWPVGTTTYQPTTADHQARALGRLVVLAERINEHAVSPQLGTIRTYRELLRDPIRRVSSLIHTMLAQLAQLHRDDPLTAERFHGLLQRYTAAIGSPQQALPAVAFLRGYLQELGQPILADRA